MKLYFSYSQIPGLAGLNRQQRRAVFRCALEAFYQEQPSRVLFGVPWIFGGMLGGVLVAGVVAVGASLGHGRLLLIAACGLVGAAVGTFIAGQLQNAILRPYLRRVLEERKDEISKIKG